MIPQAPAALVWREMTDAEKCVAVFRMHVTHPLHLSIEGGAVPDYLHDCQAAMSLLEAIGETRRREAGIYKPEITITAYPHDDCYRVDVAGIKQEGLFCTSGTRSTLGEAMCIAFLRSQGVEVTT